MDNNLTFFKTLLPIKSTINTDSWDKVTSTFNEGKHKEAFISLLRYVNPELPEKTGNKELTEFSIPHGSIVVNVKIENDIVHINAPFLKLPEKNHVPILRQIAELNFYPTNLVSIVLEGDNISFKYSCPLSACDPWKMYYVFKEICVNADNYDDEFIQKFKALRFHELKVKQFPQETLENIWNIFQTYLKEADDYIKYFDEKRIYGYNWDVLVMTFYKIDYLVSPQGILRTDIEKVISNMQNENFNINEKIEKGKDFLYNKLMKFTKEEVLQNLYISDIFIPVRYSANLQNVKDDMNNCYEGAKKEMGDKKYLAATFTIQYIFLYQLYYSYPPVNVYNIIEEALINSSNKPWEQSANILWKAIDDIMNDRFTQSATGSVQKEESSEFSSNAQKSKGFIGKIFGK